jgi:hypothetical protein
MSTLKQGIFHLAAVYGVAWGAIPTFVVLVYGGLVRFLIGHRLGGNPFQFAFSYSVVLSLVLGLFAGFANAKLLNRRIVCFVWLPPMTILLIVFVLAAPGIYPTALWDSNFRRAFRFFFGGGFKITGEYRNYQDFQALFRQNIRDWLRGYAQYRYTVPAYVGVAYSVGAWISLRISRKPAKLPNLENAVA